MLKATLWFSPLLIWLGLLEGAMWHAGEIQPVSRVIQAMDRDEGKARFMRKYLDQALYRFKSACLDHKQPRIVALGTSRVMQFRKEFFGVADNDFFNAGGMIQHLRDLEEYAMGLPPDRSPEVVILGVEMWWFNDTWADVQEQQKHYLTEKDRDDAIDGFAHGRLLQLSIRGSLNGEPFPDLSISGLLDMLRHSPAASLSKRYGLIASEKGTGFRSDGSFDYAVAEPSPDGQWTFEDREKPTVAERIRLGISGFEAVSGISENRLSRFRQVLRQLREKDVAVICFIPPFASPVVTQLENDATQAALWQNFLQEIPRIASEEGAEIFVFRTPADLGLDDRSMFDGLHGMETLHAVIVERLYKNSRCRRLLAGNPSMVEGFLADSRRTSWHVPLD